MTVYTEQDLGPHPETLIDGALATTPGRDLYTSAEIADLLLEIRSAIRRWEDTDEPGTP